jgi:hypothetical protein
MTDLLERPDLTHATDPTDLTNRTDRTDPARLSGPTELVCPPHAHTVRCWWHIELATWVCPPSGGGPT